MNKTKGDLSLLFSELHQQMGVSYRDIRQQGALYSLARSFCAAWLKEGLNWHDEDIWLLLGELNEGHDTRYYADSAYKAGYDNLLAAIGGYRYERQQKARFTPAVRKGTCTVFEQARM